jgi:hypothetical protein
MTYAGQCDGTGEVAMNSELKLTILCYCMCNKPHKISDLSRLDIQISEILKKL